MTCVSFAWGVWGTAVISKILVCDLIEQYECGRCLFTIDFYLQIFDKWNGLRSIA